MKRKPNPFALPIEKRKRLSKKRRAQLFLERGGRCHRCCDKIEAGARWICEHYISLEDGGTNEWANLVLTCNSCFHPKNRADRKKASKGRRLRASEMAHREAMAAKLIPVDVRGGMDGGKPPRRSRWPKRPFPNSKADKRRRAEWAKR